MITPEQLASGGSEHNHQQALFQWIALFGVKIDPLMQWVHAVPNGSKLIGIGTVAGKREGAKMKAEGLKPGVPDIFWPAPREQVRRGVLHGLWIEMKKPGRETEKQGGLSDEQVRWLTNLSIARYGTAVAYGWIDAAWVLATYARGTMPNPSGCAVPWLKAYGAEEPPQPFAVPT